MPLPLSPWHFSNTGFNTTEDVDVQSICVYGSKIYAGTNHRTAAYHSKVYESNDGITWTLNHTFNDKVGLPSDDQIVSMCVFNSKLYVLRSWSAQAWLYSYDGSTWSSAINLWTGIFLTPQHLATDGTKLYASGSNGSRNSIWSATNPEGVWAVELNTTGILSSVYVVVKYGSDLFASGNYSTFANGIYIYRKTGGSWDGGTQFVNSQLVSDGYLFKNKLYFVGRDKTDSSKVYLHIWDGASWTTTHLSSGYSGTSPSIFVNANNYLELQAPDTSVGGFTIYNLYHSPDGIDFSSTEPYGTNEYTNPPIMVRAHTNFQTRTLLGAGTGAQVGVYYTDQLLIANFTGTPASGPASLLVNFTDTSIGSPTSWDWDFGDLSSHGSTVDPSHTYSSPGTYTVTLTIGNDVVTDTETKINYITVTLPPPHADFSASVTTGNSPLGVTFTDLSTGSPTSWEWDFGDGSPHSFVQFPPPHVYTIAGSYTVRLVASNVGGPDLEEKINYITVNPVVANFHGVPTFGPTPLFVAFTNLSTGAPTSWSWDFGDPASGPANHSTLQSPSHIYSNTGSYTVILTVSNVGSSDIEVKANYVNANIIVADFVGTPTIGLAPLSVQFDDMSSFVPINWFWDFGDGHLETVGPTVVHLYEHPGIYTVTLTASSTTETRTETKTNYITAEVPVPVASFTASPIIGYEPTTVTFTDTSTGFPDSWFWDFGDGNTSTAESPVHEYASAGRYSVTLTITNISGSDTLMLTNLIDVRSAPHLLADFITGNITPHPLGLEVKFFEQAVGALAYIWDFGDPASGVLNTSTDSDPAHVYPGPGTYAVSLTVTHGPFTDSICKSVLVTTEPTRYMEIWGTARFSDGTQVAADKIVSVNRVVSTTGVDCIKSATDTSHAYHTIDDSGTTRFLVRARGNVLSIPESGFVDGDPVYIYVGGRLATTHSSGTIPVSVPFYMTLPSSPTSSIEVDLVFPAASTSIFPTPGTYPNHVTISLTSNITPSVIYYTTDGTDPYISPTRQLYMGPFVIEEGTTVVEFYTDDPLGSVETTQQAVYTVLPPLVVSTPVPSDYADNIFVTLTGNRPGDIYFRLDFSGGYNLYTSPIPVEADPSGIRTTIIQAYLIDSHGEVGPIVEFTYKINLVNPVISVFTLSNGDPVTAGPIITVQVIAASHTNSVIGLLLSTFSDFRDASVRLYQPEVLFLLPGPDGLKTVYAKVVDQFGVYSETKSATIDLSTEIPAFTVSLGPLAPIGELSYTFTGTKSTNSGIFLTVNGGPEMMIVPFNTDTTWEYIVSFEAGINTLVFQAGTWVGHRSPTETRTIDARPIPTGVTEATTITGPDGTWRIPFVFLDEQTGEEATVDELPPKRQHHNVKKRHHDFRIRVSASDGPDPLVTFPTEGLVLTENIITVTGRAAPGSVITLHVERRGKVPA